MGNKLSKSSKSSIRLLVVILLSMLSLLLSIYGIYIDNIFIYILGGLNFIIGVFLQVLLIRDFK